MEKQITKSERQVLDYITDYVNRCGYSPSNREICRDLNIKSTATVHLRLRRLTEAGYILPSNNLRRKIELTRKPAVVNVPMVGTIAAGQPILAEENIDGFYALPADMFGNGDVFMLKVSGDSMIDLGIRDGDSIIVKRQSTADNGQIVAALIDDSATVKQFFKENGHYRLQPYNEEMEPIIVESVDILGVVIGLLRKF